MARMTKMKLFACALLALACLTTAWARPTYVRPYGPDAPWNVPVAGLAKHPQSDLFSARLYDGGPSSPGGFSFSFDDYTYPVYYCDDATAQYTISGGYSTPNGNINGTRICWNPAWKPALGSDAQVIVLDPATGREWDLWQVSVSGTTVKVSGGSLVPGSYFTRTDSWLYARGCGIQYLAMLVQPEEVAAGVVNHALSLPTADTKAGYFVAPATKSDLTGTNGANPVPQGMRFALKITDAEIDAWVKTKPAAYQKFARVVAVALRDYGWFITDHSGTAHFQFEADASALSLWRGVGIDPTTSTARHLVDGLITQARIYALSPPPYAVTPPPVPTPIPCTAAETTACEAGYNACMAECNK